MIAYYIKQNKEITKYSKLLQRNDVKSIIFLSKILFEAKFKYWLTKLKIAVLIWTIRKIKLIIVSLDYFIVVYIDYRVSFSIVKQIKFTLNNTNRLNIKLVRVSIYLSQFRLNIYYRFEKSNLVFGTLSQLSTRSTKINYIDAFNINNYYNKTKTYIYNQAIIVINNIFRIKIQKRYLENLV